MKFSMRAKGLATFRLANAVRMRPKAAFSAFYMLVLCVVGAYVSVDCLYLVDS